MEQSNTILLACRVTPALAERVKRVTDRKKDPYAPTISKVLARGVELALQELERKRASK